MRKYLCLLPLLLLCLTASAQSQTLVRLNEAQAGTLKTGMLVLGGWAIVNILVSSFKLTRATRNRKYFYQMNLYWNVVNLVVASVALYSILTKDSSAQSLADSLYLHGWYKKVLYLNVGLDVGYMLLGVYLKERSRYSPKTERLLGWGQAIVLQGVFLFLLDLVLAVLLENYAEPLFRLIP
ncbi:DUF6992 family protein [Pontibacter actiniarum]|uniref:Uncharacterized protein n=1 Tax=Pontibacter actiniarum TaxID=323450 RepID=A0A1X9YV99_9BACT|nr:hypothetical protein [Pontibacter actiniarum]ARS36846.1 hypothetical protein CA264_16235 [Pontibacter actiniarum]